MNFWTGLILGIIIGWLVEWLIDWLFWRRDAADGRDDLTAEWPDTAQSNADLEAEWQGRLAAAESEYEARLAAVEAEWQERLNLNEQQWQTQFTALESYQADLRTEQIDSAAGATLAAAGVILADEFVPAQTDAEVWEDEFDAPGDVEMAMAAEVIDDEQFDTRELSPIVAGVGVAATLLEDEPHPLVRGRDDLTRIRGIGPKYAALLAENGIQSFDELAAADPEQLRAIIKPGPMQQINFASWSAQAGAFAAERSTQSGDDLTRLEGIGPTYASRLHEHGITTYAQLAVTDEATLAGIIAAPAWRRIQYADWIAQARLAAAGDDTGLEAIQDRLFRREGDNVGLIHGVGDRTAAALRTAGLGTFATLAAASPEQVEAAVHEAGGRGGDYSAWIEEAGVRAAGRRVLNPNRRPRAAYVVSCPQDLSAVAGIGPVLEQRLYAAGIGSYWELAELPTDELEAVLDLHAFGGVDITAIKAEAMRLAVASNSLGRAWDGTPPDDFEQLGGIGEVYERRLYEAGICTFAALAATSPERLAEICQAPAMRMPDYAAWIDRAAELNAAGSE